MTDSAEGANGGSARRYGRAVVADRVPGAEVPAEYPAGIDGEEALAVGLSFDETDDLDATVYYGWPPADDSPLERILELRDVWQDRVEDLVGEAIPVESAGDHYVPLAPEDAPYGSSIGYYGLLAGLGIDLVLFAGLFGGLVPPGMTLATALGLVNFVLLPSATYLDGWYLRTRTDWEGNPVRWAALSGFVGLNVFSVGAYLWRRRSAEPY